MIQRDLSLLLSNFKISFARFATWKVFHNSDPAIRFIPENKNIGFFDGFYRAEEKSNGKCLE